MKFKLRNFSILLFLSLLSCSPPNFSVAETEIYLYENAQPWNDIIDFLHFAREASVSDFGEEETKTIFSITIEIFPPYIALGHPWDANNDGYIDGENGGRITGKYISELEKISVLKYGKSTLDGKLSHELFQHRVPHIIEGNSNLTHEAKWMEYDLMISEGIKRKMITNGSFGIE